MTQETILPLDSPSGAPKKVSLAVAIMLALGAIVLIWSEIWVVAAIFFWAVAGLVHASGASVIILATIIFAPAIWASWYIAKSAIEAERTPEFVYDESTSITDN